MTHTVRNMTLLLIAAVLFWGLMPFWRQEQPPKPADTQAPAAPAADPFSLLLILTDDGAPTGFLVLTFRAEEAAVLGVPQNARVAVGTTFYTLSRLYDPAALQPTAAALEKQLEIPIDNSLVLDYDSYIHLMQTYVGGVTIELLEDIPIPFIGNSLILSAGRQTLTPAQVVAFWRQSADPVQTVQRQAEVMALLLDGWLTADRREEWDALFADLANTAVTDWRIDRYSIQRRTLSALSARKDPPPTAWQIPAGELVGEGAQCRFEFADETARPF